MTMPALSAASRNRTHRLVLAAFVVLVFAASPASAQATQPAPSPNQHDHTAPAVPAQPAAQTPDTHQMHDMHAMMAAMQASHARLQDLVAKMNTAQGAAKVDAIAAVVTELVASQHAMHESMQSHMAQMMGTMKMQGAAPKQ